MLMLTLSQLAVAKHRLAVAELARHDLFYFCKLNSPDPLEPFNATKSKYQWLAHHRLICDRLQELEAGAITALEIEMAPRMGKSELTVRNFVPWHAGKHTTDDMLIITATGELAAEHGRDVRDYMLGAGYAAVFGHDRKAQLRKDSMALDRLQMVGGGKIQFYGRGSIPSGVGGHVIICDDFFKSAEEAHSPAERLTAWRNFIADVNSRVNSADARRLIIGSRKHGDDVQGRLFDSTNPHYDAVEAARWTRVRIPAMSEGAGDPLARAKDDVCWPERFPRAFYLAKRNSTDPVVREDFNTQDQCNPFPEEGTYFKREHIQTYTPEELPKHLRFYGASDHAYRTGQENDRSCLLVAGIDPADVIYVMPETFWGKVETDVLIEKWLSLIDRFKTDTWWAARDAISGSIAPFLRKRQLERKIYGVIDDEIREDKDLMRRAQSIRARMAMGMVRWPKFAPWYGQMELEFLSFPKGKNDDMIASAAMLGMGLDRLVKSQSPVDTSIAKGSWAWHTRGQKQVASVKGW